MKTIIQNGIVVTMDQQMQVWDHGYVIIDGTKNRGSRAGE